MTTGAARERGGAGARVAASLVPLPPLLAVWFAGWTVAGLPFPPFDLFDWLSRRLPGSWVTSGIDAMIALSRVARAGSTSGTAKSVEQALALGLTLLLGLAVAWLLYALLDRSSEPPLAPSVVVGLVIGGLLLAIAQALRRAEPGLSVDGAWIVGTCGAWGFSLGWIAQRTRVVASPVDSPARRRFLVRAGAAGAALSATFGGAGWLMIRAAPQGGGQRWSDTHALPNAGDTTLPWPGTRRELTPLEDHYRVDTNTRVPVIDPRRWRLTVDGLVAAPAILTLDAITALPADHQFVTLECISNPLGGDLIGTTRWTGVSLQRLLASVGPTSRATHVRVASADGFFEAVSLDTIAADSRVMLAYAWDGVPLSRDHGFPLRLYVPDVYGMKQPKWIERLDLVDRWEPGYWVARGWDRDGRMKATAVIDTVLPRHARVQADGRMAVPVGGMAHAGARGVRQVQVTADGAEWHDAALREPMSATSWVLWKAAVPLPRGEHALTVRIIDGRGEVQQGRLHSRRVTL